MSIIDKVWRAYEQGGLKWAVYVTRRIKGITKLQRDCLIDSIRLYDADKKLGKV